MTAPGKITLWGRKSSANVQKVLWTLAELSLPYEHIPAGGDFGGLSDAAYLAMNPNGRIPTLKDGDLVVWESDAIVRYLAARYGAGTLWPEDPAERAIADQWMTWGTTELEVDWLWLFWRLRHLGLGWMLQLLNIAWCVGIAYSTLATKQHVALDVFAGTALALGLAQLTGIRDHAYGRSQWLRLRAAPA